jgi:hypothetical protein
MMPRPVYILRQIVPASFVRAWSNLFVFAVLSNAVPGKGS